MNEEETSPKLAGRHSNFPRDWQVPPKIMSSTPEEIGWRMKGEYIHCFFCGKPTDMKDFNPRMKAAHGVCREEYWKLEDEKLCQRCGEENWNYENSAYCLDCLKKMEAKARK